MCRLDASSYLTPTAGQELQRVTESLLQLHSRTAFCSSPATGPFSAGFRAPLFWVREGTI